MACENAAQNNLHNCSASFDNQGKHTGMQLHHWNHQLHYKKDQQRVKIWH